MDLLTKNKILRLDEIEEDKIGIYFLLRNNEIVYIGQSTNIKSRITQHGNSDKIFDRSVYFLCSKMELDYFERIHIQEYQPKYNRINNFLIGFEKIKDNLKKETGEYSDKFYQKNLKKIAEILDIKLYLMNGKIKIMPLDAKRIKDIAKAEAGVKNE